MPIKVPNDLPVRTILEQENIFVMDENRAIHQDIRPIQILILNLMTLKEDTELQILRRSRRTRSSRSSGSFPIHRCRSTAHLCGRCPTKERTRQGAIWIRST